MRYSTIIYSRNDLLKEEIPFFLTHPEISFLKQTSTETGFAGFSQSSNSKCLIIILDYTTTDRLEEIEEYLETILRNHSIVYIFAIGYHRIHWQDIGVDRYCNMPEYDPVLVRKNIIEKIIKVSEINDLERLHQFSTAESEGLCHAIKPSKFPHEKKEWDESQSLLIFNELLPALEVIWNLWTHQNEQVAEEALTIYYLWHLYEQNILTKNSDAVKSLFFSLKDYQRKVSNTHTALSLRTKYILHYDPNFEYDLELSFVKNKKKIVCLFQKVNLDRNIANVLYQPLFHWQNLLQKVQEKYIEAIIIAKDSMANPIICDELSSKYNVTYY